MIHNTRIRDARPLLQGKFLVASLCVLSLLVYSTTWVRLNIAPSVPQGLYRLAPVPDVLERGQLVVLPVPEVLRRWHPRWLPLLKPVAGVAGDWVCSTEQGLWVGEQYYGAVHAEANGQALPWTWGCFVVPAGHVFLASARPRSLDSRYYGPVPVSSVTAIAQPVWVWE